MCLWVSRPTKRLTAPSTAYAFRNRQSKQGFIKENEKNNNNNNKKQEKNEKKKSKSAKYLRYTDEFFSRLMTFHHLNTATYI